MLKPIVLLCVIGRIAAAQAATGGPVQVRVTSTSATQQMAVVYGHGWRLATPNSPTKILIADTAVAATPFTIEAPDADVEVVTVRAIGVDAQVRVDVGAPNASDLAAIGAFVIVSTTPRHASVQAFGPAEAKRSSIVGNPRTTPRS